MPKRKKDLSKPAISHPREKKSNIPHNPGELRRQAEERLSEKQSGQMSEVIEAFFSGMPPDSDPGMAVVQTRELLKKANDEIRMVVVASDKKRKAQS